MIDPAFLDELRRFDAALERQTTSMRRGEQESPDVGEGLTFSDYRRYVPGDDIRAVDWRLYARTEEYYVKQYEAERNLTVHVLIDGSGSMDFGEGDAHKFEFGAKLGLGFAYLTAEENNDFRVSVFGDGVERLDGGRSNRGELLRVIELLNERELGGETSFQSALATYAGTIRSRSLVVVVSDFLADPDEIEEGVAALAENDVVMGHVVAPEEADPGAAGDTIVRDPESGGTLRTYFGGRLVQSYRERLATHVGEVAERADRLRATHTRVDTGADFFDAFGDLWIG
jgi:uncharacterized protein (DUF58 family)